MNPWPAQAVLLLVLGGCLQAPEARHEPGDGAGDGAPDLPAPGADGSSGPQGASSGPGQGARDWTPLAPLPGGMINGLAWSPAAPETLYLATDPNNLGVWRSDDFGQTWQQVYHDDHTYTIAAHPTEAGRLLIGDKKVAEGRLMQSDDGGLTREQVLSLGRITEIEFWPRDPGRVVVASSDNPEGLHFSADGGRTFAGKEVRVENDLYNHVRAVGLHPNDPEVVYVSVDVGELFKSTDGGATWQRLLRVHQPGVDPEGADEWPGRGAIDDIEVDPLAPEVLYLGTTSGVFRSGDGGASWIDQGLSFVGDVQIAGNTLYAAAEGGVYRSVDQGGTWTRIGDFGGVAHVVVDADDPRRIVAAPASWLQPTSYWWWEGMDAHQRAVQHDGVYFTVDGGATWSQGKHFHSTDVFDFDVQGDTLFAATECGRGAFRSLDGGASWHFMEIIDPEATGGGNVMHYAMEVRVDEDLVLMTGGDGSVMSLDHGETWTLLPMYSHSHGILRDGNLILVGQSGWGIWRPDVPGAHIWRSTDGGRTWQDQSEGFPTGADTEIHTMIQDHAGSFYLSTHRWTDGTEGIGIYRSLDRGESWHVLNDGLPDLDIHTLQATDDAVYAATGGGLYRLDPAAQRWGRVSSEAVHRLAYDEENDVLYGGGWSGLLRSTDGEGWEVLEGPWPEHPEITRIRIVEGKIYVSVSGLGIFVAQV